MKILARGLVFVLNGSRVGLGFCRAARAYVKAGRACPDVDCNP
jgi:hypothetical protein